MGEEKAGMEIMRQQKSSKKVKMHEEAKTLREERQTFFF